MLIQNPFWDHNTIYDPLSSQLDNPETFPFDLSSAQTKSLAITIPINHTGKADIYIDDTIGIALDKKDSAACVSVAIPFTMHTITRPLDPLDEIPRKEIISLKKFAAEGRPSEVKMVLGWVLNTISLLDSLPQINTQNGPETLKP